MTSSWNPTFGTPQQNLVQGLIGGLTGLPAPGVIEGVPLTIGPSALVGGSEPPPAGPSAGPSVYGYDLTVPLSSSVVYPNYSDGWSTHGGRTALRASFDPFSAYLERDRFLSTLSLPVRQEETDIETLRAWKLQRRNNIEKYTDWTSVDCIKEGGPNCAGHCEFRVFARYKEPVSDGPKSFENLVVDFEGKIVGGNGASDCHWGFDLGWGSVEYTELDGQTTHKVERDQNAGRQRGGADNVRDERNRMRNAMNPADTARRTRLQGSHCETWTEEDRKWYRENALPSSVNGWEVDWECQKTETSPGMTVRRLRTPPGRRFRRFSLKFKIDLWCMCLPAGGQRANKRSLLEVDISGP